MKKRALRKCKHCRKLFIPDYRNYKRQKYCRDPACRHAYRIQIQKNWRAKKENRDYFRGKTNVERVQEWRKAHPGYWKKKRVTLQDDCDIQPVATKSVTVLGKPLQDDCFRNNPLIIGMISHFSGALQDDIASVLVSLHAKGQMILGKGPGFATKMEAEYAGKASVT